jgi:hypothetical protein
MTKHKLCPWAMRSVVGPYRKLNGGSYNIEDYTCPYCGLDMSSETDVFLVANGKTQAARLAHPKCIDNDPGWQKVEQDWNRKEQS